MVSTSLEWGDGWEEYRSLHERAGMVPDHTFISWAPLSRGKREQLILVARSQLAVLEDCDVSHAYYADLQRRRDPLLVVAPEVWAKTGLSRRVEVVRDLEKSLDIRHRSRDTPVNCEGAW